MIRIKALSKQTQGIDTLLDIGTDHGYLLIDALKNGHIKRGIAVDINDKPLENAYNNIKKEGLEQLVEFRLSDGFLNVELDYDGVLIAGMGMHLVKSILSQNHKTPDKYIVSVHTHLDQFRAFLSESGFMITDEIVVFEKFFYVIFTLIKKEQKLTEEDFFLGPILKQKKDSLLYYEHLLNIIKNIMKKAPVNRKQSLEIQSKWLLNTIEALK